MNYRNNHRAKLISPYELLLPESRYWASNHRLLRGTRVYTTDHLVGLYVTGPWRDTRMMQNYSDLPQMNEMKKTRRFIQRIIAK
jgi:hypothetical protein